MGAKRPLKKTENRRPKKSEKSGEKKLFFALRFSTIFKQKCSYLRPLLSITFPQGFQISKNIGHPTSGSGGKKTFKRYLKSEQTDVQTDGRTNRLIESIGPEGRCFEKIMKKDPSPVKLLFKNKREVKNLTFLILDQNAPKVKIWIQKLISNENAHIFFSIFFLQAFWSKMKIGKFLTSHCIFFKSRVREAKNLLSDADSSTDTKKILLRRQNLLKN